MVHKDYNGVSYPSDKLFLNPFGKFSPTIPGHFGGRFIGTKKQIFK
jgi:hypothetical protein